MAFPSREALNQGKRPPPIFNKADIIENGIPVYLWKRYSASYSFA